MPFVAHYLDANGVMKSNLDETEIVAALATGEGLLWVDINETTADDGKKGPRECSIAEAYKSFLVGGAQEPAGVWFPIPSHHLHNQGAQWYNHSRSIVLEDHDVRSQQMGND